MLRQILFLRKAIMSIKKKIRFTGVVDELRFKKERKENFSFSYENVINIEGR